MSEYYGSSHDRYNESTEGSTTHKLKNAYWTTKQVVIKKFGRKEDEHVVASDSELDSKLELFYSIQRTCMDLMRIIDRYQEKICMLSQAENELGRFLKNQGSEDKTRAGKMMTAVGKSLSFSAQQRLALRVPLSRLQQEVETFRYRAISDTLQTVTCMEQRRTDYRAALLWMKNVSENLDPDTFKQLDKFRKVQAQVRKTKTKFDKFKLDSMQKVDLLAASRCNMFSHVLSLYQTTLLQFWEKTCRTMVAVADSFKGYQYYEFSMLKDLTDESRKLAQLTRKRSVDEEPDLLGEQTHSREDNDNEKLDDFDELNKRLDEIFTGEYKDDPENEIKAAMESNKLASSKKEAHSAQAGDMKQHCKSADLMGRAGPITDIDDQDSDKAFLDDLLMPSDKMSLFDDFIGQKSSHDSKPDWGSLFGGDGGLSLSGGIDPSLSLDPADLTSSSQQTQASQMLAGIMPSALLDHRSQLSSMDPFGSLSSPPNSAPFGNGANLAQSAATTGNQGRQKNDKKNNNNAAWISMFADLDPLANPDMLSKKEGQITDT